MNRNHLALFHAVAQAGSITHGATEAGVSQPAVSKQISELEEALGVQLLERLPRGCRLTEAGRILSGFASRWCLIEKEADRAMEDYRGLKRGRLAIGASMTVGAYLLPWALGEFHAQTPEIEIQIEIANTQRIREYLLDGSVEIGLTEGPIEDDELESKVFFHDELVAIAPAGHALLKKKKIAASDLCREPFIAREEGSGTRAVVERALRRRGLKIEPLLSLSSPEAIKNMVVAGLGIAVVSRLIIQQELRTGLLEIIPVKDMVIRRPLYWQRVRHRGESPATARFLKQWFRHAKALEAATSGG